MKEVDWVNFASIDSIGQHRIKGSLNPTAETIGVIWLNHSTENGGG
jgi:hypothetical protein